MYTAEIMLKNTGSKPPEDVDSDIGWFLITLSRNGQIADRDMVIIKPTSVIRRPSTLSAATDWQVGQHRYGSCGPFS